VGRFAALSLRLRNNVWQEIKSKHNLVGLNTHNKALRLWNRQIELSLLASPCKLRDFQFACFSHLSNTTRHLLEGSFLLSIAVKLSPC
jgi:hypothetical protein